ncbi:helix-turn-helix domain-containing protein [Enterococcus sp. LJL98]
MKWIKKLNILQYSIFSYVLFFTLIFVPMSLVWYTTSKHSVTQQLELGAKNSLLQAKTNFESDLNQLDLISQQLPHDTAISLEKLSDPFKNIQSRAALTKYRLNSSLIEQVYLYYPEDPDTFYASDGSIKIESLLDLRYHNLNQSTIQKLLETTIPQFSVLEQADNGDKVFLYLVPVQDNFGKNNVTMIYTIRKSSMNAKFAPSVNEAFGEFYFIDTNQKIMGFSGEQPALIHAIEEQVQPDKPLLTTFKWQKDTYLLQQSDNELLDLSYLYIVNTKLAVARLTQIYKVSIFIIIGVFFIGLFSSVFLGRQTYRPYKKIESLLFNHEQNNRKKHSLSFEEVHGKLSTFLSENSDLKEEIKQQKPYIKESVLYQLLTGQRTDEESLYALFSSFLTKETKPHFFSIVISLEATSQSPVHYRDSFSKQLLEQLNQSTFSSFEWIGTKCLEEEALTFLIMSSGRYSQEELVEMIAEEVMNLSDVLLPIGVGTMTSDLQGMKHSFIEALTALDYRFEQPQGQVFYFEAISTFEDSNDRTFQFPEDKQLKLIQSLNLGNEEVALETLEALIQYGIKYGVTLQTFRMYSYYLINTYAHTGLAIIGDSFLNELDGCIDVKDYQQLKQQLQKMTHLICSKVEKKSMHEESDLKKALLQYINDNYQTDLLSLESVSDAFQLTPTTINKIMKEETDTTFAKYIANLRLEKIKEDLITTDSPIKDIIQQNGYYDVSNFTRKFRTTVGVTPGQYRTMYRET